jgi:molybdate transport system substrate-binding protein
MGEDIMLAKAGTASTLFFLPVFLPAFLLLIADPASAADITLLTTTNMKPIIDEVVGPFEKSTGHHLVIDHSGAAPVQNRIAGGEYADVVIHSRFAIEALQKQGRVRPGALTDVAHSSIGVALRAGSPKPAMATIDAFRAALLASSSIATPDPAGGSLGGVYFIDLVTRLGIADALKSKIKLTGAATATAELVAKGGAELGVDQLAQFAQVGGLELVTPIPAEIATGVAMTAGIVTGARQPEAAQQWIAFLASPAATAAKRAHGMEP